MRKDLPMGKMTIERTIDLVRIQYPQLLAEQIAGIQPMDISQTDAKGNTFSIFTIKLPWYWKMFYRIYNPIRRRIRKILGLYKYHEGCFGGWWD